MRRSLLLLTTMALGVLMVSSVAQAASPSAKCLQEAETLTGLGDRVAPPAQRPNTSARLLREGDSTGPIVADHDGCVLGDVLQSAYRGKAAHHSDTPTDVRAAGCGRDVTPLVQTSGRRCASFSNGMAPGGWS
jgi:hypothetical protein